MTSTMCGFLSNMEAPLQTITSVSLPLLSLPMPNSRLVHFRSEERSVPTMIGGKSLLGFGVVVAVGVAQVQKIIAGRGKG